MKAFNDLVRGAAGLVVRAVYGKPTRADPAGALLYTDRATRRVRALCPDGVDVALSGTSGGSGTLNHAALTSNLAWATSGHTGTASRIAAFDSGGAASYMAVGSDVQGYDAGLTSLTSADSAAGLAYPSAANTWTRLPLVSADLGVYTSGAGVLASYSLTASGRSLGGLTGATNDVPYFSSAGVAGVFTVTSTARTFLGQVTTVALFNNISPLTTKGDFLGHNGTDSIRVGVGTNGYVPVADSTAPAGWKWAAPSSVVGVPSVACDDVVSVLATSSNAHYYRHLRQPTLIRAKPRQIQDAVDAKGTPPTPWTLNNSARVNTASSTSGRLTWTNNTGTVATFYNGTATAAYWYRSIGAPLQVPYEWIVRLDASTLQALHTVAFGLTGTTVTTGRRSLAVDIYNNSGTYQLRYTINDGAAATVTIDATKASNGCWVRIVIHPTAAVQLWYDITTGGTDYTACTWVHWVGTSTMSVSAVGALYGTSATWSALIYSDISASNVSTVGVILASERMLNEWDIPAVVPIMGGGYATTGDTVKLIASADFGAAATPSITRARLRLADAINRLPGDAGTWTFGVTGSASANPSAPTTLQSAAAVVLKDAGTDTAASSAYRYWAVYASLASSGNLQAGSIDTALVRLET